MIRFVFKKGHSGGNMEHGWRGRTRVEAEGAKQRSPSEQRQENKYALGLNH